MTRILLISNFLNQHQLPLCNAFLNHGVDFHFIAMQKTPASRLAGGYADMNEQYPFVEKGYEEGFDLEQWIDQADAVIVGGFESNASVLALCNTRDIPFFFYSEHLYKRGSWMRFHPRAIRFVRERFLNYQDNPEFRVLCASSYLPKDLALWHFPTEKCLKWGYFPSVDEADSHHEKVLRDVDILWAGRMLDWKHPEDLITIAHHRQTIGKPVRAVMIGDGPEKEKVEHQISRLGLEQQLQMLGARPYTEVYQWMKRSRIFLFSSDHHEGWGAVLNEAMQSGCACLASQEAGSTSWLIQDGETGLIYDHGMHHKTVLTAKADQLLDSEEMCNTIAGQGKDEINTLWNADHAVSELLKFLDNPGNQPERGPVSAA